MEFPQDKFFRKTRANEAAFLQIMFRRFMWVLVLISLWVLGSYISLAMVWMVLGAVINPTAFLPYAAGASTFVTVITTKYNEFMSLAENGLKKVVDYIKSLTQGELNSMLKKMGISGSSDTSGATVSTDTVTAITEQAAALGIIDATTDDATVKKDPAAFLANLKVQIQNKMKESLREKMDKVLKQDVNYLKDYFVNVMVSIMKQDTNQLKVDLHDLLYNLNGRGSEKPFVMPEGLINVLWEFSFMQDTKISSEDFMLTIVDPIASLIMDQLTYKDWYASQELSKEALARIINMIQCLEKGDTSNVVQHLTYMIEKVAFFQPLKEHNTLFKIAINLFDGNKMNYHQIFKLLKEFIKEMKLDSEIVDFFELLLNAFNHQNITPSIRDMNMTIERFVRKTMYISEAERQNPAKYKEFKESIRLIGCNLTMFFAFIYHEFQGIPKEILRNLIDSMKTELPSYFPEQKFFKNLVPILQAGYETIGCFLDDPNLIIKKIESNASAFGIPSSSAHQIKVMSTIKYKEMYPGKEIYQVQSLQLWKDICTSLQINKKILMGLFGFVTMRFEDIKEINDLVTFMLKLGKVDIEQRTKTLDIFKLYASDSESDISTSATNLGIPRQFVPLILIAKKILDPKFVTDMEWIELGLDASDNKLLDERYSVFYDEKKFDQWRANVADKLAKVNDKIMEGNDDGSAKKTLLLLSCKGPIIKQQIKDDLDTLSTNKNKIAQFTEYQFELLTSMINSRAINKDSRSSFDSDSKTGILELSKAINLEEAKLEKILTLWFLTRSDKVQLAIKEFSPDFIGAGAEENENYENYISYVFAKMENIAQKETFVKESFNKQFGLNVPAQILNKSIFNSNATLDLNSMYEMISYPLNSLIRNDGKQMIYRDYDECLISLAPLVKYLSSHMEVQHIMLVRKIFNIEHEGIADLLMILNETSQTNSISLFLDHIDKYCGENLKFFVALLAFFQGKATNVEITNSEMKKVSIKTYLSDYFYPELLDAMYAIFMQEAQDYSDYMIKFFRRVEACKTTNTTISLQSLVQIPSTIINNFLKLVSGEDYNAQVLSKELGLSTEAIEFGSGLTRIINCTFAEKAEIIVSVCSNTDFKSALGKINVKNAEMLTFFKLLYGCYDNDDIKWIIETLGLDKDKIGEDESIIKSLLALDQVLEIYEDPAKNWVKAHKKIDIAGTLLDAMAVDKELVLLASFLLHGDFSLLAKLSDIPSYNFLFPKNSDILPDYQEFLMGLCGTISHRNQDISINILFRQYYKNLQKGIQPNDPDFMNPNSSRSYAVFCLYKSLDISPIWTFLYLGDINVWDYVWELYYFNKNYKDPFLNPLIILMIVLNYIETPTAFKEILYDMEYVTNYTNFLNDPSFKDITLPNPDKTKKDYVKLDHDSAIINESWRGYKTTSKGLTELLWANWAKSKDKLEDLAKKHLLPAEILNFWPDKDKNFTDQNITDALKQAALMSIRKKAVASQVKEIDEFCIQASKNNVSLETFLSTYEEGPIKDQIVELLESIFPEIISNVINAVSEILEDPRDNENEEEDPALLGGKKKKKDVWALPRIQSFFEDRNGNEFTMCALATIVEIRNAYFNLHDYNDRGEDHYKLFTYKLDVLLTMIEKNSFHKTFMNSFSKYRVMQLVGLSAGFCIRGEHMIRANVTAQYNDFEFQKDYTGITERYKNDAKKLSYYVMVAKLKKIWSVLSNFKEARERRYFRVYNLGSLETAIENENYYEINTEPENVIYASFPANHRFKWMPLLFDVASGNSLMDFNEEDFYFEGDIAKSRLNYIKMYLQSIHADKYDLRSGVEWGEVVTSQEKWNKLFDSDEYLLLVGLFRGHYSSITESNTFFTIRYSEIVPYLYGLLGLNASANNINENNVVSCESYITSCGAGLASNRKSLIEIIRFLYGNADTIKKFYSSFGDNEQVFEKFMKLSASTMNNVPDISSAEFLISKITGLTKLEIEVFKKIMEVSNGSTTYLDELIEESKTKKGLNVNAANALSNLINNLDIYSLRAESNLNPEYYNLRDKTTFSINMQKNSLSFYLELFKIAIFQFPDNVPANINLINIPNCDMFGEQGDKDDKTDDQKDNIKNRDRLNLLFQIINNILDGDFSIFFMLNSPDFYDVLKILNLANNPQDLKNLRVIASLKPNKLNPKLIKSRPESLDLETRAKEFKELKIICLPEGLENKEELEGKLSSLVLGMQYWNIVELLKGLDSSDDEKSANTELYCLMQSFYMWKNMSPILSNWDALNEKDSKAKIDPKVIGDSLKIFLGKILQTIRKTNQAKKLKKALASPKKLGASQIDDSMANDDQNYRNALKELKHPSNKLSHAFVNQINQYKMKGPHSHYIDWMLSISTIFSKSGPSNDPISKFEPFFTGRYLKKLGDDASMKFVMNFTLQSYSLLFNTKKAEKSKSGIDKKAEESAQLNIGPLSLIQNLPTCINLLNPVKYGSEINEARKKNLMIFDLWMRLCVLIQKKGKGNKPSDDILIGALGVLKMVLSKMQFEKMDLVYDIFNLLTGFDISGSQISNKKSPKLLETLFKVLDQAFLEKYCIKPYLNKGVLTEINKNLTILANFNVKTLADPKFQSTIIDLLCAITGTDREEATKALKSSTKKKGSSKKPAVALGKKGSTIVEDKQEEQGEVIPKNQLLELQIPEIEAIFKLVQFDINYLEPLLIRLDSDSQKLRIFNKALENAKQMNVYKKTVAIEEAPLTKAKAGESELADIIKKIQAGTATTHEVFVATDREGDSSGAISKQEFTALARRLNINLTDHRVTEIFASLKKGGTSENDEELTEEEFASALQYLTEKNTNMTLEALGISKSMLMVALTSLIIILFLVFVFIFLGIQGFAVGSSFGSVINSLLPIGAGAGVGGGKDEEKEKQTSDETLGSAVEKSKTILQSSSV